MNSDRRSLLFLTLGLSSLLLILNVIALKLHLYWTTWWMDVINHFLGGVVLALLFILICRGLGFDYSRQSNVIVVALFVFFIGILWEVFELYFGLTFIGEAKYVKDTLLDLIMDMAGMAFVYTNLIKKRK